MVRQKLSLPRTLSCIAISLILIATMLTSLAFPAQTSALSGSSFNKARIIDDKLFYTQPSLSVSSIQKFLNSKVPTCDTYGTKPHSSGTTRAAYGRANGAPPPYKCLKSIRMGTVSKPAASGLCTSLSAKTDQSAAQIIYSVSKACGIDVKVLIVMLQKEQALITDDWPWPTQYRIAMGYGCPDDAPCNSQYYGFFNQVYNAARQFKNYRKNPNSFNYAVGRTSFVSYQANNESCGGTNITMSNAATAGLYNYTPYQPNAAALSNLYGTGNSCSAYGNRNFWRLYNDWFGSTQKLLNYRLIECEDTKYLIERYITTKRELTDTAIREWGLASATFEPNDKGCDYPTFALPLDVIAQSRNTKSKYLLNSASFFKLQSRTIANAWGLGDEYNSSVGALPMLEGKTLNDLNIEAILPRLAKSKNTGRVYLLDNGKIHFVTGTPSDTTYLKLIRGYDEVPMSLISGEYLSEVKNTGGEGNPISASFRVGSQWYLFDHGKTRAVNPTYYPDRWGEISTLFNGPDISGDVPGIIGNAANINKGFRRDNAYYVIRVGGTPDSTTNANRAKFWGAYDNPTITNLLRGVILSQ